MSSQPGVVYGITKVHKKVIDAYKIAKSSVLILKSLTFNEYTVKDCIDFAKEIF